jgi:hypothetical protein
MGTTIALRTAFSSAGDGERKGERVILQFKVLVRQAWKNIRKAAYSRGLGYRQANRLFSFFKTRERRYVRDLFFSISQPFKLLQMASGDTSEIRLSLIHRLLSSGHYGQAV